MKPSLVSKKGPTIFLAPMEGVVDPVLRELIAAVGGIDYCVTEFVRVTNHVLPKKIFEEYCPELFTSSQTRTGIPVLVQLLGSNEEMMAQNAFVAAELGAHGIDLNFGCPAKTVNNHDGGAALLKAPERIHKVVAAVRKVVPPNISVSAKTRLGFDNKDYVTEIAQAAESGGANWITVHARTKTEGYRPPAHWEYITKMKEAVSIPVVANGEIWTRENFLRCQEVTGCEHFMIGRGLVANPGLALEIKDGSDKKSWQSWWPFWREFILKSKEFKNEMYALQRSKQLAKMMGQAYGEGLQLLEKIKRFEKYSDLIDAFDEIEKQTFPPSPPQIISAKKFL
jgi:tRNA-dihydrouridine synthase C